jgi:hypothetical protein
MIFPMNEIFHFSQQLSRGRFTGSRWQRIGPFPQSVDPDLSGRRIRCTSFGQALYSLPGSKLNAKDASSWFRVFYQGLTNPIYLPYTNSKIFENPSAFRLDDFAKKKHSTFVLYHDPSLLPSCRYEHLQQNYQTRL